MAMDFVQAHDLLILYTSVSVTKVKKKKKSLLVYSNSSLIEFLSVAF